MIRHAKHSEIEKILSITRACAAKMISKSILQWNDLYPSREAFQQDINRDELYVLVENEQILGCIAISSIKDVEYEGVEWLGPDGLNYYVHRLAVHPGHQGKGLAQRLMDFAEELARLKNADSIRLDTFSRNKRNQRFYEQRGYKRLGAVYFPDQSPHPFYCYELPINKDYRTREK